MPVNTVSSEAPDFKVQVQPQPVAISADQSAKESPSTVAQTVAQKQQPRHADTVVISNMAIAEAKQDPKRETHNQKIPLKVMSHFIEEYSNNGKLRTKFMDSKNNVIYQIPSEMVAKMEDLMMKTETSTNSKI